MLKISRIESSIIMPGGSIADGYTKYITNIEKRFKLDGTDLFNARYPQVLASKSVLFSPIIESTHIEPLIDGTHYVCIDEHNFQQKIDFYLSNPELLDNIVINANNWALKNCSGNIVGILHRGRAWGIEYPDRANPCIRGALLKGGWWRA